MKTKLLTMTKKLLLFVLFTVWNTSFSQGNYLDFDGVNDNVDIPNSENAVANATAITLSCKVFPKSTNPGFPNFNGIAGYRNESNFDFYLIQLSANEIEARFRNANGVAYSLSYTGLVLNQWNQLTLVYDGSVLKLYSGAAMVASIAASGSAPASNTSTFKIGLVQFQAYNWYHNGYIDEVSIWDKGLSASEISTIVSNNGQIANPSAETNLKMYYKFNQGVAYGVNTGLTSLTDEKATYNGTLNNFALSGTASNWGGQTLDNIQFTRTSGYLYPNPTSAVLNFAGFTDNASVKITDVSGRIIFATYLNTSENAVLDVSKLSSGVYLATINESKTIKFIKK